jgi:hypothetical protein
MILGELPFQPFAGTRKDREGMKRILDTKPGACISGKIKFVFCLIESFLLN